MDDSQANNDNLAERLKRHAKEQPRRKQAEIEQQRLVRVEDADGAPDSLFIVGQHATPSFVIQVEIAGIPI